MPRWLRRAIGLLTLGGSATGVSVILDAVFSTPGSILVYIVFSIFVAMYIVGVVAGLWLLEQDPRARALALPFWLLQVPVFATPWISYSMFSGMQLTFTIEGWTTLGFSWGMGASFDFDLFQGSPFLLGVNAIAVAVSMALYRTRPRALPATADAEQPEPAPVDAAD